MAIDLKPLKAVHRLLFAIPLEPLQGHRFQPTGFPALGAATYRTKDGDSLLVESAQSMANRLESTVWDQALEDVNEVVRGISHVRITREDKTFLTDTILEAHRLNSPYLLANSASPFFTLLQGELGAMEKGPVDRLLLARVLLKYDVGSLLHGVFFSRPNLAGGRLRIARSLSAFIEADGVQVAASGGVKNDHVDPQGDTNSGFGNVPFARDEYTAEKVTLYVNLDLAKIRGFGLGEPVERLLILLALYKLRAFLESGLRLRTACDLRAKPESIIAAMPNGFLLPSMDDLCAETAEAIRASEGRMVVESVAFVAKPAKTANKKGTGAGESSEETPGAEE